MPPEDKNEELARPSWVTDELLEKTVKVWSRVSERKVSVGEAIEMLKSVGQFLYLVNQTADSG